MFQLFFFSFQDAFHVDILVADPVGHQTDFTKAQETDLHKLDVHSHTHTHTHTHTLTHTQTLAYLRLLLIVIMSY